jgi:hypothetical protein
LDVDGEVDFVDVEFHATIFELVGCKIGFIAKTVDNETRFVAVGIDRVTKVFGYRPRAIVGANRAEDVLSAKAFMTIGREVECVVVGMHEWSKFVFVSVDRFAERLRIIGFEITIVVDIYLDAPNVFTSKAFWTIRCEVDHIASRGHYGIAFPIARVGWFAKIDRIGPFISFANRIPYITRTDILTIATLHKKHISTIGRERLRTFIAITIHGRREGFAVGPFGTIPMANVHIFLMFHWGISHPFRCEDGGRNHEPVSGDAWEIVVVDGIDVGEITRFEINRVGFE